MSAPIAIAGAGTAGLVAALSLARAGFAVRLFERAPALEAVGAGIQLSPNALRVLDRLGVLPAVAASGVAAASVTLRAARNGRALAEVPVEAGDGTGYLAIHRADLQDALLSAARREERIRIELGTAVTGAAPGPGGSVLVGLRDASGLERSEDAALLVGADGVRSAVAAGLGLSPARETGIAAARFVAPNDGTFERIEAWLGPRRHAVAYPMRGGREVNLVLVGPQDDGEPARAFAGWDARLRETVAGGRFMGVWPLLETDRPLVPAPGVVLVGDAAHAMLPFAAQGAAMAIEDGYVLARTLGPDADGDRERALERFAQARAARLQAVRRRVAFHRFTYHLPFPFSLGRDLTLALRPAASLRRDLAWLYEWTPEDGRSPLKAAIDA